VRRGAVGDAGENVQLNGGFERGGYLLGTESFEETFGGNVGSFGCGGHGSGS
jgi:hypothetical protein